MSRAFLYAGAPRLVATLWPIPDTATSALMPKFYSYLAQGMDARRALQKAQVDLIQAGHTHPVYWAAFILIGETGDIKMEKAAASLSWTVILSIVALASAFGRGVLENQSRAYSLLRLFRNGGDMWI